MQWGELATGPLVKPHSCTAMYCYGAIIPNTLVRLAGRLYAQLCIHILKVVHLSYVAIVYVSAGVTSQGTPSECRHVHVYGTSIASPRGAIIEGALEKACQRPHRRECVRSVSCSVTQHL